MTDPEATERNMIFDEYLDGESSDTDGAGCGQEPCDYPGLFTLDGSPSRQYITPAIHS